MAIDLAEVMEDVHIDAWDWKQADEEIQAYGCNSKHLLEAPTLLALISGIDEIVSHVKMRYVVTHIGFEDTLYGELDDTDQGIEEVTEGFNPWYDGENWNAYINFQLDLSDTEIESPV